MRGEREGGEEAGAEDEVGRQMEAGVQALEGGVADSMTWRTSEALAGECPPWLEYRGIEDAAIRLLDMIDEMAH